MRGGRSIYSTGAIALIVLHVFMSVNLWEGKDFSDNGSLSLTSPDLAEPFEGGLSFEETLAECFGNAFAPGLTSRIVGAQIAGKPYYACYRHDGRYLRDARVVDAGKGLWIRGLRIGRAHRGVLRRRTTDPNTAGSAQGGGVVMPTDPAAPVGVTLFKEHNRVRLQMLTHDVSRDEAEKILNTIADALGIKIVDQSNADAEEKIREAFRDASSSGRDPQRAREAPPRRRPERA